MIFPKEKPAPKNLNSYYINIPKLFEFGMLEKWLVLFEKIVMTNKKIKGRFDTLLKNKLMEKADKYIFLNPFSGEFEYAN